MPGATADFIRTLFEFAITCPCGCTECHIEGVRVRQNDRLTRVGRRGARTVSVPPRGRGSAVYVDLHCESGCLFSAVYAFSKGSVRAAIVDRGTYEPSNPPPALWRD